jgi:hypothetical protein
MTDSDWVKQERDHEYRMACLKEEDNRRRRATITERIVAVSWALGIALVVGIVVAGIYYWQHDAGQRGKQSELACISAGGTWTAIGGGTSDVCVHLREIQ